ncbi:nuclear transport factor 2 family protein [Rhodococcus sp. SGAir0479]|uniref:nuclear transport factor 2 family protein n=1 Tax=Rhodococcus sp. SGAir0479 TaxID=2567884 RepID=UPI0010CCCEF3|nr:nuclear transport factor 2 family protein [Rhodococcus sp. SGAir0479]QCQ93213.1 nuclear transport factor 2 family protein [Rhodococcus sp. SGAir0479]
MPSRSEICAVLESYVEHLSNHDVDKLVGLFAEGAVQHEPLGVQTFRGLDEIRAFDEKNAAVDFTVSRYSPIVVSGRYAAMQVRVQREGMSAFLASDLFEFDDSGKIVALSVVIDPEARV